MPKLVTVVLTFASAGFAAGGSTSIGDGATSVTVTLNRVFLSAAAAGSVGWLIGSETPDCPGAGLGPGRLVVGWITTEGAWLRLEGMAAEGTWPLMICTLFSASIVRNCTALNELVLVRVTLWPVALPF